MVLVAASFAAPDASRSGRPHLVIHRVEYHARLVACPADRSGGYPLFRADGCRSSGGRLPLPGFGYPCRCRCCRHHTLLAGLVALREASSPLTSLLFAIVGVLVCLLLADLRLKEDRLADNVLELEQAREQLLHDEKLAAMGRLSSAIAHEIRNPVAMIASSIATARQLTGAEREEMFEIASDEASRLSQLTTEFLDYASTRPPNLAPTSLADAIAYVADASRAHASQKGIRFQFDVLEKVIVQVDESQLHQALMNLLLNAVDATPAGGTITLRCRNGNQSACIEVENAGLPIPESALNRIFEPFFTTKPRGTGLGLAIARNIARAQGGDLTLFTNVPARICFALSLPVSNDGIKTKKV